MARRALTAAAVLAVTTVTACSVPPPTPGAAPSVAPPPTRGSIAAAPTTRLGAAPPTASATDGIQPADPTGDLWSPSPITAPPPAPRLTPEPGDYADPTAVARAYFAARCYHLPGASETASVERAVPWLTADGWADDHARAINPDPVERQDAVGTACGPVRAAVSPQGPSTESVAWVGITARQAWVRDGTVIGDHPVAQVRRVVRVPDGRWLVDVRVTAG